MSINTKREKDGEKERISSSFWRGRWFCSTSDGIQCKIKTLYL